MRMGELVYLVRILLTRGEVRSVYPSYDKVVKLLTDADLVGWMVNVNLGSESTRQLYPALLKGKRYTAISNIPTALGEAVAKI